MKHQTNEEWEQAHINALTLKMIFLAVGGTVLAAAIAYVLRKTALGDIQPELLFIPWGIVLVLGVSAGFKRGVAAERERYAHMTMDTAPAAKKTATRKTRKRKTTARKTASKTVSAATTAKAASVTAPAKKTAAKKSTAKKSTAAKKPAAKKTAGRKPAVKKAAAKKK